MFKDSETLCQATPAEGRCARVVGRERPSIGDRTLEAAKMGPFLRDGVAQFYPKSLPRAGFGIGLRDFAGVDPDAGRGGRYNQHLSEKGGRRSHRSIYRA